MVGTPPTISTNNTSFNVGDTLYVTITFNGSYGGYLYVGDTEISIVAPRGVSSYIYSYDLTTSGVYNVHFYDYMNLLDSNIIAITVTGSSSSSSVFLTTITKVKTALENVFVKKSNTVGLIKNDGTIDTNTYLTQHQDITGKEDTSNKASTFTSKTDDVHYPTTKLVKDTLDNLTNAVDYYFDDTTEEIIFDYGLVTDNLIVADNLTTNSSTQVLSAKQGKILNEKIGEAIDYINQ